MDAFQTFGPSMELATKYLLYFACFKTCVGLHESLKVSGMDVTQKFEPQPLFWLYSGLKAEKVRLVLPELIMKHQ